MILRRFKEKSNRKYISKCLKNRVVRPDSAVVKKIGVLVVNNEFSSLEWIVSLAKALKVNQNNLKMLSLYNIDEGETSVFTNTFSEKDLGWKGQFKSQEVKDFLNEDFDLLINFYEAKILPMQVVAAASKAKLKVGISNADQSINDLIIDTPIKDKSVFKTELIKYLNILNKIK